MSRYFDGDMNNFMEGLFKSDIRSRGDEISIDLGEESVIRRTWDYDHNDLLRYVARANPYGSEEMFLKQRGKMFGEALYSSMEEVLEDEKEVYMVKEEETNRMRSSDPREISWRILDALAGEKDIVFYEAALDSLPREERDESKEYRAENQI